MAIKSVPSCCAGRSHRQFLGHLIEKPVGAAFKKNSATGLFEEIKAPQLGFRENRSEDWWQIRVAKAKQ